jgi:hypothetical protein
MEASRVFDLADRGVWKRTGECSRCGECCRGEPEVHRPDLFSADEVAGRECPGHCPLLRRAGDRFGCAGHGRHAFYLTGCDQHPTCPDDMRDTPSCSYRFERVG